MGSAYKEGISVQEIAAFFEGNDKIVNLNNGGYVAKGKFDDVNSKYQASTEGTKDYEDIKTKYNELVATTTKHKYLDVIGKYVKPEFKEYAYFQLNENKQLDDKLEDHLKEFTKANSQYALEKENPSKGRIVVRTYNDMDGEGAKEAGDFHKSFNDVIRNTINNK